MRALDAERIHQRGRVGGEVRVRYSPGGVSDGPTPRLSNVVIRQRSLEPRDLVDPARALVGEAGDEDDVVALSCLLGVQLHAACIDHSHRAILESRGQRMRRACSVYVCGSRSGRSVSRNSPPPMSVIWPGSASHGTESCSSSAVSSRPAAEHGRDDLADAVVPLVGHVVREHLIGLDVGAALVPDHRLGLLEVRVLDDEQAVLARRRRAPTAPGGPRG